MFSRVAVSLHIPTNNIQMIQCLYIFFQNLMLSLCVILTVVISMLWYLIVVLVWISLMANDSEDLCLYLFAICISSLVKCIFLSFAYYMIGFACFYSFLFCLHCIFSAFYLYKYSGSESLIDSIYLSHFKHLIWQSLNFNCCV